MGCVTPNRRRHLAEHGERSRSHRTDQCPPRDGKGARGVCAAAHRAIVVWGSLGVHPLQCDIVTLNHAGLIEAGWHIRARRRARLGNSGAPLLPDDVCKTCD